MIDNNSIVAFVPFIMKIDDSLSKIPDDFYVCSSYEDKSLADLNLTVENGWLTIGNKNIKDKIIINDTINGEYHEIDHFNEFYTSWRAHGTLELPIKEINFNKYEIVYITKNS